MADAPAPTLPTYRAERGRFDELVDGEGRPRPHWQRLVSVFDRLGPAAIDERRRQADRLLATEGASYVVHDDGHDDGRPWQIDPVPLVWPAHDWATLERGLSQRTRLLEALLADLYGPQRLLHDRVVPAELVLASPWFRWACVGLSPTAGPRLTIAGADVVRDAAGRLVVLRDHTDAPGGAGYALVNRRVLSRLFPDVYREQRVERLTGWFAELRAALARLAPPDRPSPRTVVLTEGIGHPSYFEHTYLASYLGYHLVEGADLAVRGGRTWLRALAGLEPVDVVLRRVEDGDADPLELGSSRPGGVTGLVEAARQGGVGIANALGSGLAGDVALQAYLGPACQALLGETLLLPSPPTWWLGDAGQRADALADLDAMVIHQLGPGGVTSVFAGELDGSDRDTLVRAIDAKPGGYVAQTRLELATAPVLEGDAVVPGTVVVRTLVLASTPSPDAAHPTTLALLPGGLGRVVRGDQPLLTQRGGTAKDVWVVADRSRAPEARAGDWQARIAPVPQVDLRTSLPSRAAEALFWVGRNAERAEATARLALTLVQRFEQSPELAELHHGAWLTRSLEGLRAVSGGTAAGVDDPPILRAELVGALGDRSGGLADSLSHLAVSAGSVREFLSTSTWRLVGLLDGHRIGLLADAGKADLFQVAESLQDVVQSLMALAGLANESVVRGPGWRFLDLGRRLERAIGLLGLLEAMVVPATPPAAREPLYETLLAACESLIAYRRRYRSDLELDALCDLLLGDDTNPRALAFQLDRITEDLAFLPDRRELVHQRELAQATYRTVLAAPWLERGRTTADAPDLGLQQLVLDARGHLLELTESLVAAWFTHVGEVRVVGWRRGDGDR